jgi:Rieske 2Fe-2S family protein
MRAVQRLNQRLNKEVAAEDAELVARVQAGMATTGWRPGPLGEREAAVAWFADRVRRDLEAPA